MLIRCALFFGVLRNAHLGIGIPERLITWNWYFVRERTKSMPEFEICSEAKLFFVNSLKRFQ